MKKILCFLMTAVLVTLTAVTASGKNGYDFDYETDDYLRFANIISDFGTAGKGVRAQAEASDDYDVRRTVIVKTDGRKPDISGFYPDVTVDGPDDVFILSFSDVDTAEKCVKSVSKRPGVIYAECDSVVSVAEAVEDENQIPDEPSEEEFYYHSWGMEFMHADVMAREVRKTQSEDDEVLIAVVDSGITEDHPIFEGRLAECRDMTASEEGCKDEKGHGTNVAGVIADCTQGLNVKIMAIRVLDENGNGSAAVSAAGIEYAVRKGADIINASLASRSCSIRFHDAQKTATDNGCIFIASAGNYGINMDEDVCCPAHISEVVTVTAVNRNGELYHNNCYGNAVDVAAPGVLITCASMNGGYIQNTGTSFAAPHVSAIAAMFMLAVPDASDDDIIRMIKGNTIDIGKKFFDVYSGWGMPWLLNFSKDAVPKVVEEMVIKTYPEKMTYTYKENLDSTGLSVELTYNTGEKEVLEDIFTVSTPEMKYGENKVTVTLSEFTQDFTVTVNYTWWQWIIVILLFGWIWY